MPYLLEEFEARFDQLLNPKKQKELQEKYEAIFKEINDEGEPVSEEEEDPFVSRENSPCPNCDHVHCEILKAVDYPPKSIKCDGECYERNDATFKANEKFLACQHCKQILKVLKNLFMVNSVNSMKNSFNLFKFPN